MTAPDSPAEPTLRFKRRKVSHAKRAPLDEGIISSAHLAPDHATGNGTLIADAPLSTPIEEDTTSNLRKALRNRVRPRDRIREGARKPELSQAQALVAADAPRQDLYGSRFVAQTGQVVDKDDKQM